MKLGWRGGSVEEMRMGGNIGVVVRVVVFGEVLGSEVAGVGGFDG